MLKQDPPAPTAAFYGANTGGTVWPGVMLTVPMRGGRNMRRLLNRNDARRLAAQLLAGANWGDAHDNMGPCAPGIYDAANAPTFDDGVAACLDGYMADLDARKAANPAACYDCRYCAPTYARNGHGVDVTHAPDCPYVKPGMIGGWGQFGAR